MDDDFYLFYLIEGNAEISYISVSYNSNGKPVKVDDLRNIIFEDDCKGIVRNRKHLTLSKIDVDSLHPGNHLPLLRFNEGDEGVEELAPWRTINEIWPSPPPAQRIHIFVTLTGFLDKIGGMRNTLEAGYLVYYAFWWGAGLDDLLRLVPGSSLKYLPKEIVLSLQLDRLQFGESVLLVREEYKTAYSYLDSHEAEEEGSSRGGGRVVLGQPGIGKSCFLYYLLFRLLSQKKNVAFQVKDNFLLFQDTGVSICSFDASNGSIMPDRIWALSDSHPGPVFGPPCEAFLTACRPSRAWVVQATSPLEARWKGWSKEHGAKMYWMDVFTVDEMNALGKILNLKIELMRNCYDSWGPSARNCIEYARRPRNISSYEDDVLLAAGRLIKDDKDFTSLKEASATHRIFVVRPSPGSRQIASVDFGTKRLREIAGRAYTKQANADRYSFYRTIRSHPWFAAPAGHMYEAHVLLWVCHARDTATLSCTGAKADSPELKIPSCPGNVMFIEYVDQLTKINEPEGPMCLIPTSRTFPTLDAVVLTSNAVITVQIRISPKHDAKEKGFGLIYQNLPPDLLDKRPHRCHVFITDEDSNAKSLRAQNRKGIPNGTLIYSTVIGVNDLDSQAPATAERMEALEKAKAPATTECVEALEKAKEPLSEAMETGD